MLDGFQPTSVTSNGENDCKRGNSSHCQREHQTPAKSPDFPLHSKT